MHALISLFRVIDKVLEGGIVRVPLAALRPFGGLGLVSLFVTDGVFGAGTHVLVLRDGVALSAPYRPLALARSLDPAKHIVQQQRVAALQAVCVYVCV